MNSPGGPLRPTAPASGRTPSARRLLSHFGPLRPGGPLHPKNSIPPGTGPQTGAYSAHSADHSARDPSSHSARQLRPGRTTPPSSFRPQLRPSFRPAGGPLCPSDFPISGHSARRENGLYSALNSARKSRVYSAPKMVRAEWFQVGRAQWFARKFWAEWSALKNRPLRRAE